LSSQLDAIAQFVDIPREMLTAEHHTNASPDESDLLKELNPSLFKEHCVRYAGDVLQHAGFSMR
jgi:hypothetical protein